MISRVEERIDQELLPAYYKAYEASGDKESLAYPEEVPHPNGSCVCVTVIAVQRLCEYIE